MELQKQPNYPSLLLEYFIDQLAEYIVLNEDAPMCCLCVRGSCDHQVSGLTCRCGVRDWLTMHRELFSRSLPKVTIIELQKQPNYPSLLLENFIDQLAEYILLDADTPMCCLCVSGSCDHQASGLTCRCGVRNWLTMHREQFSRSLPEEIQKQFAFLDALRSSGAVNMYGAAPYLEKEFPYWSPDWYKTLVQLWMDTFQERMGEA